MGASEEFARKWFREVWADGGEEAVNRMVAPEAIGHMEGRTVIGPAEVNEGRTQLLTAFPDLKVHLEDVIEQGEKVVVRWTATGTHSGPGLGIPPENQPVSFRGTTWLELHDGKIVRGWDSWNLGGLLMSLAGPKKG